VQRGRDLTISQVRPVIACIACMRPHTHTPTHQHTANNRNDRSAPHAARMQHPHRPSRDSSPEQQGSTKRQLHRLRTHGLHPVSQDALSRRYTPPVERRAHQHMAEQTSARCTRCTPAPSTPPPAHARAASTMVEAPHHAKRSDSAPPALRPRSSSAHPDAHRPVPVSGPHSVTEEHSPGCAGCVAETKFRSQAPYIPLGRYVP